MKPSCSIDNRPVPLSDWQADVSVERGDSSLTGRVPRWARWAEQGAPVTLWRRADDPLWTGELVADPRAEGDWLHIRGEGLANRLEAATVPLLYRIDGAGAWREGDADPHNYAASEKYDITLGEGHITWKIGDGNTAYAVGNAASVVLWLEGCSITRYSIQVEPDIALGNFDLLTHQSAGPSGTRTLEGTHTLAGIGGTPTTYARTLTTPNDLLSLRMTCTGANTPAARHRVKVNQFKVYGRTLTDTFTLADVVRDVAGLAELDTAGVQDHATVALPLYWAEDGFGALLAYMAELADWVCMVRGSAVVFQPYGARTWQASTDTGTAAPLEPEPRYNRFTQPYRTLAGQMRYATATPTEDPFPGEVVAAPLPEPLEDPQPNGTLALAVATARVEYEASYRVSGQVDMGRLRFRGADRSRYDVEAGDLLSLTDLGLTPQRITAVSYRPDEGVSVQLGEAFNLVSTMAALERANRGRKRRRGKRGKA